MIELLKKNISFLVIGVAVIISIQISLDDMVDKEKYVSLTVPKFTSPIEISNFTDPLPSKFPPIIVDVLLGEQTPFEIKLLPVINKKKQSTIRPLKINAIMIYGKEKIVNINGSILKVGENINGRRILKIEKNGVLVTGPNGNKRLKFQN